MTRNFQLARHFLSTLRYEDQYEKFGENMFSIGVMGEWEWRWRWYQAYPRCWNKIFGNLDARDSAGDSPHRATPAWTRSLAPQKLGDTRIRSWCPIVWCEYSIPRGVSAGTEVPLELCIHTYMHACMHTYINTYIHTCIQTMICTAVLLIRVTSRSVIDARSAVIASFTIVPWCFVIVVETSSVATVCDEQTWRASSSVTDASPLTLLERHSALLQQVRIWFASACIYTSYSCLQTLSTAGPLRHRHHSRPEKTATNVFDTQ